MCFSTRATAQSMDFIDERGAVAIIRLTHFGNTDQTCCVGEAPLFGGTHERFHRYEKVHAVSWSFYLNRYCLMEILVSLVAARRRANRRTRPELILKPTPTAALQLHTQ